MKTTTERQKAAADLRKMLRGIDEIITVTTYTGMTAYVRLFVVKHNKMCSITHIAGDAMGEKTVHGNAYNGHYGLKYGGGGYSKPFQAVYDLGRALYPKGYKHTAKNCHSNDHFNGVTTEHHRDGGYRFKQVEL